MSKGKICLLVVLSVLVLVLILATVRQDPAEESAFENDIKAPTDVNQLLTESAETLNSDVTVQVTEGKEDNTVDITSTLPAESGANQNETSNPNHAVKVQPEGEETLPPEVDAVLGVEEDPEVGELEEINQGNSTEQPAPTEPKPSEIAPTVKPSTGDTTDPLSDNFDFTSLTYEGYMGMTGEQQKAVVEWFSSPDMFIKWFNLVEARYKEAHPDIEIGSDGVIDLS